MEINLNNKTILVTGAAGFIGSNLVKSLIDSFPTATIVGLDNCNDYYDVSLKDYRLAEIEKLGGNWTFVRGNLADKELINSLLLESVDNRQKESD